MYYQEQSETNTEPVAVRFEWCRSRFSKISAVFVVFRDKCPGGNVGDHGGRQGPILQVCIREIDKARVKDINIVRRKYRN